MNKIAPKQQQFETLFQMMAAFPDEQSAIDHFRSGRAQAAEAARHCRPNAR